MAVRLWFERAWERAMALLKDREGTLAGAWLKEQSQWLRYASLRPLDL